MLQLWMVNSVLFRMINQPIKQVIKGQHLIHHFIRWWCQQCSNNLAISLTVQAINHRLLPLHFRINRIALSTQRQIHQSVQQQISWPLDSPIVNIRIARQMNQPISRSLNQNRGHDLVQLRLFPINRRNLHHHNCSLLYVLLLLLFQQPLILIQTAKTALWKRWLLLLLYY